MVHEQIGTAATIAAWIFLSLALNFGITGVVNATDYAYSFIPDVDEIFTGKRREGQYASINSTIDNIFKSLEAIVITSVLSAVGFVEGATVQPEPVVNALTNIFVFVPIAFCRARPGFFSFRIKLNDDTRVILAKEIDRLRNGGSKADVDSRPRRSSRSSPAIPTRSAGATTASSISRKRSKRPLGSWRKMNPCGAPIGAPGICGIERKRVMVSLSVNGRHAQRSNASLTLRMSQDGKATSLVVDGPELLCGLSGAEGDPVETTASIAITTSTVKRAISYPPVWT